MKDYLKDCLTIRLLLLLPLVAQWGCSPDMFFGNSKDSGVEQMTTYRKVNFACGSMNVSSSTLDVKTFRSILKCFNANGELEPVDRLFNGMPDEKIEPLIRFINRYFLNNKKRLYEIETSYYALASAGIVEDVFSQMGRLLKNKQLVSSAIALLREGFFDSQKIDPDFLKLLELISTRLTYKKLLKGVDFGIHLTGEPAFRDLQEDWRRPTKGPAADQSNDPALFQRSMTGLFEYLKAEHTFECGGNRHLIRKPLIESIRDGYLFDTLNRLFSIESRPLGRRTKSALDEEAALKTSISQINSLLEVILSQGSEAVGSSSKRSTFSWQSTDFSNIAPEDLERLSLLEQLSVALNVLKKSQVSCMKSAQEISDLGTYLVRELVENSSNPTEYILRTEPLNLMMLRPVCDFPLSLAKHYPTLIRIAESGTMPTFANLLKIIYEAKPPAYSRFSGLFSKEAEIASVPSRTWSRKCEDKQHPLAQWLIEFLSDTNLDRDHCQGLSCLTPILSEVTERGAWKNILLLATSPNKRDVRVLRDLLQFVVEEVPELGERPHSEITQDSSARQSLVPVYMSPNDLMLRVVSRQGTTNFLNFALSLRSFVMDDAQFKDNFIHHSLITLRKAYSINNVHPLLDMIWEAMSDATKNGDFFDSLFEISRQPYFLDTIELTSKMAEDGRLKQIIEVLIQIYHKFAMEGKKSVQIVNYGTQYPIPPSYPLHRIRSHDLFPSKEPIRKMNPYCRLLDFNFSLAHVDDPRFAQQLDAFTRCLESAGENQKNAKAIRFLGENPAVLKSQIDLLKRFESGPSALSKEEFRRLIDVWVASVDSGDFYRFLGAVNLLVEGPRSYQVTPTPNPASDRGDQGNEGGGVLAPLLAVLGSSLEKARAHFTGVERYLSQVIRWETFPALIEDGLDLVRRRRNLISDRPADPQDQFTQRLAKMEKWVKKDPSDNGPLFEQIKKWVRAKECATLAVDSEEAVNARAQEIVNEAWDNYTNGDLVYHPVEKVYKPRQGWGFEEFRKTLKPVLHLISDPHSSNEKRRFLQANLNFLKYFNAPQRGAHYPPGYLLKWLRDRSTDYKLITYYYPDEGLPRVRLVNSLDRFELVMMNVDFDYPLVAGGKNMALDFLQVMGEAWGDMQDRSKWPAEIRAKYQVDGPRPRTVAEAVENILNRPGVLGLLGGPLAAQVPGVKWLWSENFDNLIEIFGFPPRPACWQDLAGDAPPPQRNTAKETVARGFRSQAPEWRRNLYNLKQVNSVLVENSKRGADGSSAGLEVFRDLFFESFYSNTTDVTENFFGPARTGQANNLKITLQFIQMGFLRQIGRILQRFPEEITNEEDAEQLSLLSDFNKSMIHIASSPQTEETIYTLLNPDESYALNSEFSIFWSFVKQIFNVIEDAESAPANVRAERRLELERMKQLGFYFPALLEQLEPIETAKFYNDDPSPRFRPRFKSERKSDLFDLILETIRLVVKQDVGFLEGQEDLYRDILRSEIFAEVLPSIYFDATQETKGRISNLLKLSNSQGWPSVSLDLMGLVKRIYGDPSAYADWSSLWQNTKALIKSSELDDLVSASQRARNRSTTADEDAMISAKVRAVLAKAIENGEFHPVLRLAREKPQGVHSLFESFSQSMGREERGELKNFFEMLRRGLSVGRD